MSADRIAVDHQGFCCRVAWACRASSRTIRTTTLVRVVSTLQPLSLLDISLYDTLFLSAKHAYLRDFRSSLSKGVQLGQVAIYCRVSTDDECCERQERDLRAFARRAGHHIVGVFKETASGAKNDRVERKKVMALAQARDIALTTSDHAFKTAGPISLSSPARCWNCTLRPA